MEIKEITKPNVLVVEGRDEEEFFMALTNHMSLHNIQVMGIGGKTNLRQNLEALTLSPHFTEVISLGIVRDADTDPSTAFLSVSDALKRVDLSAPRRPLVTSGEKPRVTVMILPKAGVLGMLEDLCLSSVTQDSAMVCVEEYFQCLQRQDLSLPRNLSKARVQVFLASKPKVVKRLGEAAEAGYWPLDDKAFEQVRDFLQQIGS